VPGAAAGVVGTRHHTAVRGELFLGREAIDIVDFELDREGADLLDAGDAHKALDVGIRHQMRVQRLLELLDLLGQELGLHLVRACGQLHQFGQVGDLAHVHLLEEALDRTRGGGVPLDERQARPEDIAQRTKLIANHVRFGEHVETEQLGQRAGVGRVGLDLCSRNRLDALGVRETELDIERGEGVLYPVPARRAFDDGVVPARLIGKVQRQGRRMTRQLLVSNLPAVGINGRGDDRALVPIESRIEYGILRSFDGDKRQVSRTLGSSAKRMLVGKIYPLYADETLYGLAFLTLTDSVACPIIRVAFRG
jgi:hypothetical protein